MSFQRGKGRGRGLLASKRNVSESGSREETEVSDSRCTMISVKLEMDLETGEWFMRLKNMWHLREFPKIF